MNLLLYPIRVLYRSVNKEKTISSIISISNLSKTYKDGFKALKNVNLEINRGEIFALLGPNGAGKTTLISMICGITNITQGKVTINGFDCVRDHRNSKSLIGLVPQELTTNAFETVWNSVKFSRGLFGMPRNNDYLKKVLKDLSLWDKKDKQLRTLSGGMKRRVMIAKALSHEPAVLFLDEPTAGVDVELRQDMWKKISMLKQAGVTIILTTHYIDEAEEMADRVGVISRGELIVVEEKHTLMKKMGKKEMILDLVNPLQSIPDSLSHYKLSIEDNKLILLYDTHKETNEISSLFSKLEKLGIKYKDIMTQESSLEDIFVEIVR